MLRSLDLTSLSLSSLRARAASPKACVGQQEFEHPSCLIHNFCQRHPEIQKLELSVYSYKPQTIRDERRTFQVSPQELLARFEEEENRLGTEQEIAFHSHIRAGRGWSPRLYHLPLIDFSSDIKEQDFLRLIELSQSFGCAEFDIFHSGRSFHYYGLKLLSSREWIRFMGRILLLNAPNVEPLVDARWVGHRLMAGYSSLRWTKNTAHYQRRPTLDRSRQKDSAVKEQRAPNLISV